MPTHEVTMAQLREARLSTKKKKWKTLRKPTDQFGRQYIAWVDTENGDTVGTIERTVQAPVDLPDKYMRIDPDRPWRMNLDFVPYIKELRAAANEWTAIADAMMTKHYGEKGTDTPYTARVLKDAGPKPQDWRVVEMARRGDPWALGLTTTRTKAIRALIGDEPFIPKQLSTADFDLGGDSFDLGDEFEREFGKLVGRTTSFQSAEDRDRAAEAAYRAQAAKEIAEAEADAASEIVDGATDLQLGDDIFSDDAVAEQVMSGYSANDLDDIHDGAATGGTKAPVRRQRIPREKE